jgi:hypothetical protein
MHSSHAEIFSGNLEPMTELYFAAQRCKQDLLHILYCMGKGEHVPSMVDTICSSRSGWWTRRRERSATPRQPAKLKSQSLKFISNKPEEVRERSIYHVIYLGYDALTNCSRLLLSKLVFTTVLYCNKVGWGLMCRLLYAN